MPLPIRIALFLFGINSLYPKICGRSWKVSPICSASTTADKPMSMPRIPFLSSIVSVHVVPSLITSPFNNAAKEYCGLSCPFAIEISYEILSVSEIKLAEILSNRMPFVLRVSTLRVPLIPATGEVFISIYAELNPYPMYDMKRANGFSCPVFIYSVAVGNFLRKLDSSILRSVHWRLISSDKVEYTSISDIYPTFAFAHNVKSPHTTSISVVSS